MKQVILDNPLILDYPLIQEWLCWLMQNTVTLTISF